MKGKCIECDKELQFQANWCPRCNYNLDADGRRIGFAGATEPSPTDGIIAEIPEVPVADA